MSDNAKKIIPASVDKAIENITDKPTKNIGTTFADLWYLVFGGVSHAADKRRIKYQIALEEYEKECHKKIDAIPIEKRIEPDVQTAASALEASKYCAENKEVREMFANLIASSMNSDTADLTHPSFPEILRQMSSLDAQILSKFQFKKQYAICEYRQSVENGGYKLLDTNVFIHEYDNNELEDIKKREVSITSLVRCGVLIVNYTQGLRDDSQYDDFYKTGLYKYYTEKTSTPSAVTVKKGVISTTPLGDQLLSICLPDSV